MVLLEGKSASPNPGCRIIGGRTTTVSFLDLQACHSARDYYVSLPRRRDLRIAKLRPGAMGTGSQWSHLDQDSGLLAENRRGI